MQMTDKNMTIILLSASGVLIAGLGYVAYDQGIVVHDELTTKNTKLRGDLAEANRQVKAIPDLTKEVETLQATVTEMEGEGRGKSPIIPSIYHSRHPQGKYKDVIDEYDDLFNAIEEIRKESGILISGVKRQTQPAAAAAPGKAAVTLPKGFEKVVYEVKTSGGFFPLLRFLHGLENSRRFIKVENFTIGGAAGGDKEIGVYPLTVQISSFASTELIGAAKTGGVLAPKPAGPQPPPK